jgi:phosphoribosylformylglycinamidine synthase
MSSANPTLSSIRVGVVQFPGSNCDDDCVDVLNRHFGIVAPKIWHTECVLPKLDALIIPGGFSFGDYLRSGALAARSPVIDPIRSFAQKGGAILGICNGFQILTESNLLPGALLQNQGMKFICKMTRIKSANGNVLSVPIAHGEGRYWIQETELRALEDREMIAYQYCSDEGSIDFDNNPNGSVANIAGIYSKNKKILGMMPHPERATDQLMGGSDDGIQVLRDFLGKI